MHESLLKPELIYLVLVANTAVSGNLAITAKSKNPLKDAGWILSLSLIIQMFIVLTIFTNLETAAKGTHEFDNLKMLMGLVATLMLMPTWIFIKQRRGQSVWEEMWISRRGKTPRIGVHTPSDHSNSDLRE